MRKGSANGNWKGGISLFKTADDLLLLSKAAQLTVLRKIRKRSVFDPKTRCTVWTGELFHNGRARLTLGCNHLVSRLVWVLHNGPIGDKNVLHSCDNKRCVGVSHLWLGTNADNSADMVAKGRSARGERNSGAKLSAKEVKEIRFQLQLRVRPTNLARKYGVSSTTIYYIRDRRTWRHLR